MTPYVEAEAPLRLLSVRGGSAPPRVLAAETADGHRLEMADAMDDDGLAGRREEAARPKHPFESTPDGPRRVLSISTSLGCPVRCTFCDAGGHYEGRLTAEEILAQIDLLLAQPGPAAAIDVQLTRMGEPAFNPAVLEALASLPARCGSSLGVSALLATVVPAQTEGFFERLLELARAWPSGRLRLRISLHTTDPAARARLVPVRVQEARAVAAYGTRFHAASGVRVALAFATSEALPVDPAILRPLFAPDDFTVRLGPLHPTEAAGRAQMSPLASARSAALAAALRADGYEVEEVSASAVDLEVGAACGQYVSGGRDRLRPRRTRL